MYVTARRRHVRPFKVYTNILEHRGIKLETKFFAKLIINIIEHNKIDCLIFDIKSLFSHKTLSKVNFFKSSVAHIISHIHFKNSSKSVYKYF